METPNFVQVSALPGWIIGVSQVKGRGYQCWVINANLDVLGDGTVYTTSSAALSAGRTFIERQR
ncbi:MAG: hypothetical protein IGR92_00185 [Leptolyngbyaceae cyanobacterium T60_A2020_046]|nr:hypothetical protein [Leptolyngbyaceae cyanobacterium T60_A2020_046]